MGWCEINYKAKTVEEYNNSLPPKAVKCLWYDKMFDNIDMFELSQVKEIDPDYTHWCYLPESPDFD
jgi:hypothetical protein